MDTNIRPYNTRSLAAKLADSPHAMHPTSDPDQADVAMKRLPTTFVPTVNKSPPTDLPTTDGDHDGDARRAADDDHSPRDPLEHHTPPG